MILDRAGILYSHRPKRAAFAPPAPSQKGKRSRLALTFFGPGAIATRGQFSESDQKRAAIPNAAAPGMNCSNPRPRQLIRLYPRLAFHIRDCAALYAEGY